MACTAADLGRGMVMVAMEARRAVGGCPKPIAQTDFRITAASTNLSVEPFGLSFFVRGV